jgi:tetraacyldisaccharide 4'-kinase
LPAGRLRERPSAASRADLVLLWQCDRVVPSPLEAVAAEGRLFRARRRVEGLFDPDGAPRPAPGRAYLLSGIARPERFAEDAGRTMRAIVGHARFPDHHAFTASEIARVAADAHAAAADAIVTTAKDAVRLPANPPGPPVLVLRVAAEVDDGARFRERLIAAARRS